MCKQMLDVNNMKELNGKTNQIQNIRNRNFSENMIKLFVSFK